MHKEGAIILGFLALSGAGRVARAQGYSSDQYAILKQWGASHGWQLRGLVTDSQAWAPIYASSDASADQSNGRDSNPEASYDPTLAQNLAVKAVCAASGICDPMAIAADPVAAALQGLYLQEFKARYQADYREDYENDWVQANRVEAACQAGYRRGLLGGTPGGRPRSPGVDETGQSYWPVGDPGSIDLSLSVDSAERRWAGGSPVSLPQYAGYQASLYEASLGPGGGSTPDGQLFQRCFETGYRQAWKLGPGGQVAIDVVVGILNAIQGSPAPSGSNGSRFAPTLPGRPGQSVPSGLQPGGGVTR